MSGKEQEENIVKRIGKSVISFNGLLLFLLVVIIVTTFYSVTNYEKIVESIAQLHLDLANEHTLLEQNVEDAAPYIGPPPPQEINANPMETPSKQKYQTIGEIGDSFGPINASLSALAALVSTCSLVVVIVSVRYQIKELTATRKAQQELSRSSHTQMAVQVIVNTLDELQKEDVYKSILALDQIPDTTWNTEKKRFDRVYKDYLDPNKTDEDKRSLEDMYPWLKDVEDHIHNILLPFQKAYTIFTSHDHVFSEDLLNHLFRSREITKAFLYVALTLESQKPEYYDHELYRYFFINFKKQHSSYLQPYLDCIKTAEWEKDVAHAFGEDELDVTQHVLEAHLEAVSTLKLDVDARNTANAEINYQLGTVLLIGDGGKGTSHPSEAEIRDKHQTIETYFRTATDLNPKHAKAWNGWGNALGRQGFHKEAAEKFAQATRCDTEYANAWYNWGVALGRQGFNEEAAKKYEQATRCDPEYANAWHNWGVVLERQKRYEEAAEKYAQATRCDPEDANAWRGWGVALDMQGLHKEAAKKFEQATRCDPEFAKAWHSWGVALERQKLYEEAAEKYFKAATLDATKRRALLNLSCRVRSEGNAELADAIKRRYEELRKS